MITIKSDADTSVEISVDCDFNKTTLELMKQLIDHVYEAREKNQIVIEAAMAANEELPMEDDEDDD